MEDNLFINVGGNLMDFRSPKVMGIVNVTPDSFYGGSRVETAEAVRRRVAEMRSDGADIIDIGGFSSRPGASDVSPEEEYNRLAGGLEAVRIEWPEAIVSVDTFRAEVARRCVEEWDVAIVNDIGGGTLDPDMWDTVAELGVTYVLMHMRGTPATMTGLSDYGDVTAEVLSDLAFKLAKLREAGVADVIIDPGFGFAKTVEQNYRLLADLREFRVLGAPLLAGLSRKTMIWKTLGVTADEARDGTIALDTVALMNGADILRVHDVRPAVETIKLLEQLPSNG